MKQTLDSGCQWMRWLNADSHSHWSSLCTTGQTLMFRTQTLWRHTSARGTFTVWTFSAEGFALRDIRLLTKTFVTRKHTGLAESKFDGADFTNAIVDRASFKGSSLRNAIFKNAVLTGTSFEDADVEGADFTEVAIGQFDLRNLCKNPTLKGQNAKTGEDTRASLGCS